MTRKRFKKLLMAQGIQRNEVRAIARAFAVEADFDYASAYFCCNTCPTRLRWIVETMEERYERK